MTDYRPEQIAAATPTICGECGYGEVSRQAPSGLMRCNSCGEVNIQATGERLRAALDALEAAQEMREYWWRLFKAADDRADAAQASLLRAEAEVEHLKEENAKGRRYAFPAGQTFARAESAEAELARLKAGR